MTETEIHAVREKRTLFANKVCDGSMCWRFCGHQPIRRSFTYSKTCLAQTRPASADLFLSYIWRRQMVLTQDECSYLNTVTYPIHMHISHLFFGLLGHTWLSQHLLKPRSRPVHVAFDMTFGQNRLTVNRLIISDSTSKEQH